tara:strand:+ start:247057 stop:247746 length:690 start_codon:yes stop_codon:yes gene_type:complete
MKLQQTANVIDADSEATQTEVSTGSPAGPSGPAFDFQALQEQMQGGGGQQPAVPSQEDLQSAMDGMQHGEAADVGVSEEGGETGPGGESIRDHIFSLLEGLGVPRRAIMTNPDSLFQAKKDLGSSSVTGFYMLPSYVQDRQINQKEAEGIAAKIGQQFGLQQSISHKGNNFKVDFKTMDVAPTGSGSSFDELLGQKGGQQKAAQTQSEMIREGRSQLVETLLRVSRGES